jgi:hypothetical protein
MSTVKYEKNGSIYECSLTLENGTEIKIPMREDGYIFATALCKAAGKQFTRWKNKSDTKKIIKKLENKISNISRSAIIKIKIDFKF